MAYTPPSGFKPSGSSVQDYLWQLMNLPTDQGNIGSEWLGAGYQQPQSPEELYAYLQSINFGADKPWGGQTNWLQNSAPGDLNDPMSPSYTKTDSGSLVGDWLKDFGPVLAAPLATGVMAGGGLYGGGLEAGAGLGDAAWGVNLGQSGLGSEAAGGFYGGLGEGTGTAATGGGMDVAAGGAMDMFGSMNPSGSGSAFTGSGLWGSGTQAASGLPQWMKDWGITGGNLLNAGGNVLGAGIGYLGSQSAAKAQQEAASNQQALLKYMYDQNRADLAPWRQAGVGALGTMVNLTTPGKQFDQMALDPGYQFRLGQGEQGINRAAASRGSFDSGGTLKALQRYGQDYASNEFSNVFNRQASLAGLGQTAVGQGVNAGQNYANNAGNSMLQAGDARASGYMGGANAVAGGIGSFLNNYNEMTLLDKFLAGRK